MTTMEQELINIGFNKNEAKVYSALIKLKKASAHRLIQETKFHKNIVYDNLEKLIDKGLVTYIIEEGRKTFKLAPSNMLIEFFEEKEKEIQNKKKEAKKLADEIDETLKKVKHPQEAMIYKGVKGIKSFYNETLQGRDYIVFGAPKESLELMGETFWKNYNLKRIKNKIDVRMVFNPSIKSYGNKIKNKFTHVKYFDKDFEPLTETHIQEDKVGIIVWTEEPVLFLIQDKNVAESYRKFFESMWRVSKK